VFSFRSRLFNIRLEGTMSEDSIANELNKDGVSRRDFMKLCGLMAGMMGLEYLPPSA